MLPISLVGTPLEMTKRRWKELMQALYENHFDPRKDEELKQSKIDIDDKLSKIIKLVKERRSNRRNRNVEANLRKESELIELIEDFHKQYQFVYDQYDDIRGHLSPTVIGAKEDEGYFTATSSSDSETESEKDVIIEEKKTVNSEFNGAMNKEQEFDNKMQELKEKLDEKGREISLLVQMQKRCQREVSGLMKELESELSSFNIKMGGMRSEKKLSEQRVENKELQDQFSNLEQIAKEMDEEISELIRKGVEGVVEEEGLVHEVSKIKGLFIQVNQLKLNMDSLFNSTQQSYTEDQKTGPNSTNGVHENLRDQVNKMKHDLGSMRKKNTELESNIKKKVQENSGILSQIDNLKNEVASKGEELQKLLKEREDSLVRVKNLEVETQHLNTQKSVIEQENSKLTQEIEGLRGKVEKMEKMLKDREDQLTMLQKNFENGQDDKSAQIVALMAQINHIKQELESKNELETQISELGKAKESLQAKISDMNLLMTEREDEIAELQRTSQVGASGVGYLQGELSVERRKFSERLNELESQNNELSFKVSDQDFMIKQQEDIIKKLRADCKLVKGRFFQAAERKMDEVAEECRKNFDDQFRILSRRIKVAEQLHAETKENWKKTQERCEQQHPGLLKKLAQQTISSSGNSELRTTVSQGVDEMVKGMECLVSNLECKEADYLGRLSKVSNEIQIAKNWVRWTIDGVKPSKHEPPQGSIHEPMMDDKEQDKMMKEKVRRLEAKVNKEKGDKSRLMRGMYEMQKKVADLEKEVVEKNAELLRLGEEKVEAIKQLCMWVDYRQSRFDQLKEMMLVKKTKSKGGTSYA